MWNKKQIAKVKRYLKSKDFANKIKEIEAKHNERDTIEKQEQIKWWNEIKDVPFGSSLL